MASQEEKDRVMAEYLAQVQGDDDDDEDEDEGEFQPGCDDDDDDDDDDEEEEVLYDDDEEDEDEEEYIIMKGALSRHDGKVMYKGNCSDGSKFQYASKHSPLHWSLHHPTKTTPEEDPPPTRRTIEMEGNIELAISTKRNASNPVSNGKTTGEAGDKSTGDDDDGDEKPAASPSKFAPSSSLCTYMVFGKGRDASGAFEFLGELDPSQAVRHEIPLECRKRVLTKSPPVAAAASAAKDDDEVVDDDDDDDDNGDHQVDMDELIALHQEAGLSVVELRKRYHERDNGEEDGKEGDNKKTKTKQDSDDDDNDDEYGF